MFIVLVESLLSNISRTVKYPVIVNHDKDTQSAPGAALSNSLSFTKRRLNSSRPKLTSNSSSWAGKFTGATTNNGISKLHTFGEQLGCLLAVETHTHLPTGEQRKSERKGDQYLLPGGMHSTLCAISAKIKNKQEKGGSSHEFSNTNFEQTAWGQLCLEVKQAQDARSADQNYKLKVTMSEWIQCMPTLVVGQITILPSPSSRATPGKKKTQSSKVAGNCKTTTKPTKTALHAEPAQHWCLLLPIIAFVNQRSALLSQWQDNSTTVSVCVCTKLKCLISNFPRPILPISPNKKPLELHTGIQN